MGLGFLCDLIKSICGFRIVPEEEIKPHFTFLSAQNSDFDSLGLTLPLFQTGMESLLISLGTRGKSGFGCAKLESAALNKDKLMPLNNDIFFKLISHYQGLYQGTNQVTTFSYHFIFYQSWSFP